MAKIERGAMTQTDAKGKVIRAPRKDNSNEVVQYKWWDAEEAEVGQQVTSTISFIQNHQHDRLSQLVNDTRLYGKMGLENLLGTSYRSVGTFSGTMGNRISFNLCASVIDTLQAKMAKNKVTPTFVTNGGVWGMQKKSRDLSKFIDGCFYQNDVHTKGTQAFRDAAVWGTGILHITEEAGHICVERTFPHELYVDMIETLSTDPRQLHRVKIADRGVMMAMFKDDEEAVEAIKKCQPAAYTEIGGEGTAADLIKVTESWHLRSGEDESDGRHVICVDDYAILDEEYEKDYFPFAFFNYSKELFGFWGKSACDRLQSLQTEINRLMILIQKSMWVGGSFKILSHVMDKIPTQHFTNEVGPIIKWSGDIPPQYIAPQFIQQDIYPYVDSLIAKGFQQEGVSQLSAGSMKPQGLDSGKALRVYNDLEADRQLFMAQEMERFYLEISRQMIEKARDIYKKSKTYVVTFPTGRFMETIDWKDVQLERDQYVLKAFPTSSLSDDISGRLQEVQELSQAGMISPRTARKLLRTPDLEMSDNLALAAEDLICKVIEDMLDNEEQGDFEDYMDQQLARQLALQYMNYAKFQNAPQKVLTLVENFIGQIDTLQGLATPPPEPGPGQQIGAGPEGGGAAPANPTPPPTSSLLPNVNGGQAA